MSIEVDAAEAIASVRSLAAEQIPAWSKEFLNQLALEMRKVMVQKVTTGPIKVQSGGLRNCIEIVTVPGGVEVGPTNIFDQPYPMFVGLGTSKMPPRPFHEWTYDEVAGKAPAIAKTVADRILKG